MFAHGWAYSLDFFNPLLLDLNKEHPTLMQQFKTLGLEQGYFERPAGVYEWTGSHWAKAPETPEMLIKTGSTAMGIGHSLGFAKLLELPCTWASLVGLHGFTRFTAQERGQTGTPRRLVERMLNRLSTNPETVLQDFWMRAEELNASAGNEYQSAQAEKFTRSAHVDKLRADLQSMLDMDLTSHLKLNFTATGREFPNKQFVALYSQHDQIVSPDLTAQTFPAQCMQEAIAPHSGPLVSPKVYTPHLIKVLSQALGPRNL